MTKAYEDKKLREAAVNDLRKLVRKWARQGFGFNEIISYLLQFDGQGDDGIDEEVQEQIAIANAQQRKGRQ